MGRKNKRERPTRRGAERMEQSGVPLPKKQRREVDDEQPFMQSVKGAGAPPTQQRAQQQAARGGQSKQQQQQQAPQKQGKAQQKAAPASSSAAAAASSGPRKKKSAAEAAAAVEDEPEPDTYNQTPLDGHAIAFGSGGSAATVTPQGVELDSGMTAQSFFEWLIYPLSIESFYLNYFEKKPLFISRADIANKLKASCTLVTTKKDLEEYLPVDGVPGEHHYAPSHAAGTAPAHVSEKETKTKANALRTERVTVVEVPSAAATIAAPAASAAPAAAAAAASSSASASSSKLSHYYANWFSIPDIHSLLADPSKDIKYREDIDITRYRNGVRETLNPSGPASEQQVRNFIESEECSLRFLCPHKYSDKLWRMLNLLDEFFGMQTGANSYYTPKGTQGFAPHFDDVDVFVIQTEGCKRWRLYAPREAGEILPNISSPNYAQAEIGSPIMDVLLRAGDFLYAPRGTIHQCVAAREHHSLHVTLSTCLRTNWNQYFAVMLPRVLQLASEESIDLRRSLPHKYERYMGVMHADSRSNGQRERFMDRFMELLTNMVDEDTLPFDAAADQLQTEFLAGRVPPALTDAVAKRTAKVLLAGKDAKAKKKLIKLTTCVRLVQEGVARITTSAKGDSVTLHHILQNSRLYQEKPLASLEFPIGYAMTLEALLLSYPKYVAVRQLPPPDAEDEDGDGEVDPAAAEADLIELVETLFEEGLIEITNDPSIIPEELRKGDEDSDDDGEGEEEDDEEEEEEEEGEDGEEMMEDGEEEEGEDEEEQE